MIDFEDFIDMYDIEEKPVDTVIYRTSDIINQCQEHRTNITLELKTLTSIGKWIRNNGVENDNTISSLSRRTFHYDTNYQRIIISESSFYDDDDGWVIHYSVHFMNINNIRQNDKSCYNYEKIKHIVNYSIICLSIISYILFLYYYRRYSI